MQSSLLPSDYHSIIFKIALTKPPTKISCCYYTFNYSKGNYDGFHEYLMHSDFSFCSQSHKLRLYGYISRMSLIILQWGCISHKLSFVLINILNGSPLILDTILNTCVLYVINSDCILLMKWQPRLNQLRFYFRRKFDGEKQLWIISNKWFCSSQ